MARIFVSGANGFIGRAICTGLTRRGHHVIAGVRVQPPAPAFESASICETGPLELNNSLEQHLANVDSVIHAAGWAGEAKTVAADQQQSDPIAAQRLCSAAVTAGVEHFILVSSIKAIGSQTLGQPFSESSPPQPKDTYGATKLQSERALSEVKGIAKTIIRLPAIYGPGMKGGILTLFGLASHRIPLPLKGLKNERDFLSLISMSDFVATCVERPLGASERERILLVCDGRPVSSSELYDLIARSLGLRSFQFSIPEFLAKAAATSKSGSLQSLFGSLRVNDAWSRTQLQWSPPVDFEEALRATAMWYQKQKQ